MSKFTKKKGDSDVQASTPAVSKDSASYKGNGSRKSRKRSPSSRDDSCDRINNYGVLDGTHNDPAWYHLNDTANKAAGSLPFGFVLGSKRDDRYFPLAAKLSVEDPTPGLAVIWYTPIPGMSSDANSALNVVTQGAYAWIRHANSGHTNYDPSDLMLYYLAIDNAQTLYAWMCKIYGNLSKYSAVNRYFPEDWFRAVNIDFADFQNNIPGFLAYLNMYALKLATFAVPAEFPIFKRHALLASSMFTDSGISQSKFQVYDFEPRHIFKYTGLDTSAHVTCLTPVKMPNVGGSPLTFAKLTEFADSIINPLVSNVDDFGTMSGDVRKAYMNGGLFTVNMIGSDYTTNFLYDELMLQQIHNMDLWGELLIDPAAAGTTQINSSNYRIEAGAATDTIIYEPTTCIALPLESGEAPRGLEIRGAKTVLVDKDAPTADDVFEVTRDVSFVSLLGESAVPGVHVCKYDVVGTEVFENIAFVKAPGTGSTFMYTTLMTLMSNTSSMELSAIFPHIENMMAAHAFRYDPEARIAILYNEGKNGNNAIRGWISPDNRSLQNWTIMQRDSFEVINNVAMMSLWNVPRLGKSF